MIGPGSLIRRSRWRPWLILGGVLLMLAACGSADDTGTPQVNIIEIVQLPTLITPASDTPLPPTSTPTQLPSPTQTHTPTIADTTTPAPSTTPMDLIQLVVAVKPIPAGAPIPPEAVMLVDWPQANTPMEYFTALDAVINEVALVDIGCYEPVLPHAVAYREIGTGFDPLPGICPPVSALSDASNLSLTRIVMARKDIAPGQRIEPDDIAMRSWPGVYLPAGVYHSMSEILGHVALKAIQREQPITTDRVAPAG